MVTNAPTHNKLSTEWYSRVRYRQPPILEPRPITESTFSQEKVFKNLSGDDSRILSGVVGKQSKDRFLTCTIIGFRARECLYVEPLGSCGVYENEARFLLLDSTSQILSLRDDDELPFTDLPVARDILVYDLERIANVQNPDVMSLIDDKPVWRVKSYDLVETSPFTKSVVFVEQLHPTEHAVTVNGPWFTEPEYLHMASYEMPPLHSFLDGLVYASEYKTEAHLLRGALIYVKLPADSVRKVGCACCAVRTRTCYVSLPIRLNDEEVVQSEATVYDAYKMTLTEYLRETYLGNPPAPTHQVRTKKEKCKKNVVKCDQKEKKPVEQNQPSSSQVMTKLKKKRKPRMRRHHYEDRGGLNRTHSLELADVETAGETACKQAVEVVNNIPMEVVNNSQTEVVKPDPVECSLCTTDIQPMDEVYFKVCCLDDCRLFVHKKCMQESLAAQGLRKKREYKDGICPTEGCSARIQNIFEYSIKNEESLYLKCAEKPEKKVTDILPKKDKKKEKHVKTKDTTVDSELVTGSPDVKEELKTVAVDVPPSSEQPEVAAAGPEMSPSPKPHRPVPLPVDIDNVVPLEKEKDPLEVKYAVAEQQQQKKTKAPKKEEGCS